MKRLTLCIVVLSLLVIAVPVSAEGWVVGLSYCYHTPTWTADLTFSLAGPQPTEIGYNVDDFSQYGPVSNAVSIGVLSSGQSKTVTVIGQHYYTPLWKVEGQWQRGTGQWIIPTGANECGQPSAAAPTSDPVRSVSVLCPASDTGLVYRRWLDAPVVVCAQRGSQ